MSKYFLTIDIGTQSLKVALFDKKGEMKGFSKIIYKTPYISKKSGYAEKNPNEYWDSLIIACKSLWEQGFSPKDVASVSVSTHRATTVLLDDKGKPLREAILWLDQREAKSVPNLGIYEIIFKVVLVHKGIKYLQKKTPTNWIAENEPKVWEKTRKVLLLSGFINYKLTNNFIDSTASQVGYIPFNFKKQEWEKRNNWKYRALSIEQDMLPNLKPPGDILGYLTKQAASSLGLPSGIPIISSASDKACELLGCGITESSQACLGLGTTATVSTSSDKYIELTKFSPAYPSAIKKKYTIEYQVFRGLWLISWFKEQFAKSEMQIAEKLGISAENLLDNLAQNIKAGSEGLISQPFWNPGLKYPGLHAKGCIIGFNDFHKKEHVYRSLVEGLIFALKEGTELIQSKTKKPITEIYICGGGAKSDFIIQCAADIMNKEIKKPKYSETTSLGAAILSSVALGVYKDMSIAIENMTNTTRIVKPNPKNIDIYSKIYSKIFKNILTKLYRIYESIDKIYENLEN